MSLDGHLSSTTVASSIKQPTRKLTGRHMLRCGLASDGVYICPSCYQEGGSLLHCPSTLTASNAAVHFCCTVLGVASTGCYPASLPCEARTFLAWHLSACQPRPFILLTSFAKRILSQFYGFVNLFVSYRSKHPPPINSRISELFGIASPGIGRK